MSTINRRVYADGRTVYRVRVRRHGLGVSRQFATEAEAEAFANATEGDFEGRAPAESHTLAQLIDKYRQIAPPTYGRECLEYWSAKIGHLRPTDVTPAIVRAHRDELARTPARSHNYKTERVRSPTTVRKYLVALGAVFKYATNELDWSIDNPVRKVTKPKAAKHRVRFLTADERGRLLDAARRSDSPTLFAGVLLSLSTGLRKGELHKLLWADVDLTAGLAILRDTKNGDSRGVPLTPDVIAAMTAIVTEDERVFPCELTKAYRTAVRRAGIVGFRWHDMRHDAGSRLAAAGVSTRTIMELLGHRSQGMALNYQHLTGATVRDAVLRVMT